MLSSFKIWNRVLPGRGGSLSRRLCTGRDTFDRHLKRSQRDDAARETPPGGFRLQAYAAHRVAERLRDVKRSGFTDAVFVPCGPGMAATATIAEIERPETVTLVDLSPEMVARAKGEVELTLGSEAEVRYI